MGVTASAGKQMMASMEIQSFLLHLPWLLLWLVFCCHLLGFCMDVIIS